MLWNCECDVDGHLLTELVNCGPTTQGKRNPWLSPFFITTGESLQPSNMFWGLQFRKPSGMRTESSSLSDPGSDGTILMPPYATKVTSDALSGTSMLSVEDSSMIGKYILLGMYNTTADGNLVKELLGVDELRPEWVTARRAGTHRPVPRNGPHVDGGCASGGALLRPSVALHPQVRSRPAQQRHECPRPSLCDHRQITAGLAARQKLKPLSDIV